MDETQDLVITPHRGQATVLTTDKRFVLALAGIQGGKTFIGCVWLQIEVQKKPQGTHLVCALSKDQLSNVVIRKFLEMFPAYKPLYNKSEAKISLPTGGEIVFKSLDDPKYVEGITAHSAWIDEADLITYPGYLVVRGRVNATGGRLLMTSSISDNSWLADYANRLNEKDFELVTWGSIENPAFTKAEWESLKNELDPTIFRRRYEARLSFATGKVYSAFDKERHVIDKLPEGTIIQRGFIGIDWGHVDPTAIIMILLSRDQIVYVRKEFAVEGAPLDLIVKVIQRFKAEMKQDYGCGVTIYADPSNKQFLREVALRAKVEILRGERDIFHGTSLIRNLIYQNRFFVFRECPGVLKEIRQYRFKERHWERKEEPEDKNNHCFAPDSLVYTTKGKVKIKDLVGEEGYLYSRGGRVERFYNVRKTRLNTETLKIEFDDNQVLEVTPDHLLLLPSGLWIEASLLSVGFLIQSVMYENTNIQWKNLYKIQWGKLFQAWKENITQGCLGILQWGDSERDARSLQRQQQRKQQYKELTTGKSKNSFGTTHDKREKNEAERVGRKDKTSFQEVAQIKRGQGVACVTWNRHIQEKETYKEKLCSLPQRIYNYSVCKISSVLPPELQDESKTKKVKRITRGFCSATYNLEVENTHCLLVNGVIAHNSLDAIRYVLATYPIQSVEYKKGVDKEDPPDFWLRRSKAYQNEVDKEKFNLVGTNLGSDNIWTP
jgi:phage terminase large subunit